ncbi:hypothetical protein LCER1_G004971 [Lachnellula cervina]|uniref:Uncharacterized protein n=1 Tax=Lachnellula cervina TaxID=1316786 RepID=A0A7D8UT84_9HELO|nr:hypothetical protein LCER1_G004971 [Lachnellula cervina]
MAIKAINDLVGPNSIILMLLVFSAYLRIVNSIILLLGIAIRVEAIKKATREIANFSIGLKNKKKTPLLDINFKKAFIIELEVEEKEIIIIFIIYKEKADLELSLKLYREGKITTLEKPFKQSNIKEFNSLLSKGIFGFKLYNK